MSRQDIDLAIVNLNLKPETPFLDKTGYLILEDIDQNWPHLPKIVLSALEESSEDLARETSDKEPPNGGRKGMKMAEKVVELYSRYGVKHVAIKGGEDFCVELVRAVDKHIEQARTEDMDTKRELVEPVAVKESPRPNYVLNQPQKTGADLPENPHVQAPSLHNPDKSSRQVTWLHLSDFHFRKQEPWSAKIVLRELLKDIEERTDRVDPSLEQIDLIFITGDVSFSGCHKEYELAAAFLKQLRSTMKGFRKTRLFIVPGNHDVNRQKVHPHTKKNLLEDRESVDEIYYTHKTRADFLHRFQDYRQFIGDNYNHMSLDQDSLYYVKYRIVGGRRIYIAGLNSAWASSEDGEYGKLILGDAQVRGALEQIPDRKDIIRIALYHHPLDWLQEFDRNGCEPQCLKGFDFILHGHLHKAGITSLAGPGRQAMVVGAGACYLGRDRPNAYNFVRLDLENQEGTIYFREYTDRDGGHWAKDVKTYAEAPDGRYDFSLKGKF
jgi:predicted phosphodiesterase